MILRSMLFVPGDSERKLAEGEFSPAGALILDLEDSVAPDRTAIAQEMVRAYLDSRPDRSRQQLWVRVNPLATPKAVADLATVVRGAPDGILLPKPDLAADILLLDNHLTALEVRDGIAPNSIRIIPVATETAKAVFALGTYAGCSKRLRGMTWGADDLPAALGLSTNKDDGGGYALTCEFARSMCLAGAIAADVQPIDTLFVDFRDWAGLTRDSKIARQLGFTGQIAIHPDKVVPINAACRPAEEEVAFARRMADAFAVSPGIGVIGLDGNMLDMIRRHPNIRRERQRHAAADALAVDPADEGFPNFRAAVQQLTLLGQYEFLHARQRRDEAFQIRIDREGPLPGAGDDADTDFGIIAHRDSRVGQGLVMLGVHHVQPLGAIHVDGGDAVLGSKSIVTGCSFPRRLRCLIRPLPRRPSS